MRDTIFGGLSRMGDHHQGSLDRQPATSGDLHQAGAALTQAVNPTLLRYSRGEISALRAAALLGEDVSVSDVIVAAKLAGLGPPRQSAEQEAPELAYARRVLEMDQLP